MTAHSRQTQSEEQALTGFADTVFSLKQTNKTKKMQYQWKQHRWYTFAATNEQINSESKSAY